MAPFLDFDDGEHVDAAIVTGAVPLYTAFTQANGSIFPLTLVSFRIERALFSDVLRITNWAPLCRIDNLLLHALAGALLWLIFRNLRISLPWRVLIVGAFLFHPMACESVCWVSERKNVLAAAFGFAAISAALKEHLKFRGFTVIVLYACALMSKPSALGLLPTLLLLQAPIVVRKISSDDADSSPMAPSPTVLSSLSVAVALVVTAAAAISLSLQSHTHMIMKPPGGTVFTALLTDTEIIRRYMQNLLFPIALSAAYAVKPIVSVLDPRFLVNGAIVFGVVAGTVWLSRRRALSLFFWWWFFAGLGPVMNLVATMLLMQDRYVYLSAPAFFGAVILALSGVYSRVNSNTVSTVSTPAPRAAWVAITAILAALVTSAVVRSTVWQNTYTLFGDAVEKQPLSALAHWNFALALVNSARFAESHNMPIDDVREMRLRAVRELETTTKLDDFERLVNPAKPLVVLSYVQLDLGHEFDAQASCRKALLLPFFPQRIEAHLVLAKIAQQNDRFSEALDHAQEAIRIAQANDNFPAGPAWLMAGIALERLNRIDEAADAYSKVEATAPEFNSAQEKLKLLKAR